MMMYDNLEVIDFGKELNDMIKRKNIAKTNDEQYYRLGAQDAAALFAEYFLEIVNHKKYGYFDKTIYKEIG